MTLEEIRSHPINTEATKIQVEIAAQCAETNERIAQLNEKLTKMLEKFDAFMAFMIAKFPDTVMQKVEIPAKRTRLAETQVAEK